jgi:hypothetical protein
VSEKIGVLPRLNPAGSARLAMNGTSPGAKTFAPTREKSSPDGVRATTYTSTRMAPGVLADADRT